MTKQRQESLVLLSTCQVVHDILYNLHINLFVQKLSVVTKNFFDGVLCEEIVLICCHHTLVEEVGNPLRYVKLVEVVVFDTVL